MIETHPSRFLSQETRRREPLAGGSRFIVFHRRVATEASYVGPFGALTPLVGTSPWRGARFGAASFPFASLETRRVSNQTRCFMQYKKIDDHSFCFVSNDSSSGWERAEELALALEDLRRRHPAKSFQVVPIEMSDMRVLITALIIMQ